jgi:hypothetical protein
MEFVPQLLSRQLSDLQMQRDWMKQKAKQKDWD